MVCGTLRECHRRENAQLSPQGHAHVTFGRLTLKECSNFQPSNLIPSHNSYYKIPMSVRECTLYAYVGIISCVIAQPNLVTL